MKEYRAARINGTLYLEEFMNNKAVRLVARAVIENKDDWDSRYREYARIAQLMNEDLLVQEGDCDE